MIRMTVILPIRFILTIKRNKTFLNKCDNELTKIRIEYEKSNKVVREFAEIER